MFTIAKEIHFSYGHRVLGTPTKCVHLHGHNGKAVIVLAAESLDAKGMVMEFSDVKSHVQTWIERELDHKMLLCKDDPAVEAVKKLGDPVFLMDSNPTAENIAKLIFDYAKSKGLPVTAVTLWETHSSSATYSE